jgi:DNA ligase-1
MINFVKLFKSLDQTTSQNAKIAALVSYFEDNTVTDLDKLWTVAIFSHRRPPRAVNTTLLRQWSSEISGYPLWLFEETYHIVGDLAETIALLGMDTNMSYQTSLSERIHQLKELKKVKDVEAQKSILSNYWAEMDKDERFLFNKLLTGGFRVGISQSLVAKALAKTLEKDEGYIANRLMGNWTPNNTSWEELLLTENSGTFISKPYPFYLAYALDKDLNVLGDSRDWAAEYKWDGIRSQIIVRDHHVFVWTRGEELVTEKFPEFESFKTYEKNIVIDGEIVILKSDNTLGTFNDLQTRIGRKNVSKTTLIDSPIGMIAYDLLEYDGEDIRGMSYEERRNILRQVVSDLSSTGKILFSESFVFDSWEDVRALRAGALEKGAEGLMLKLQKSEYKSGRKVGEWYKWKLDPYTVDAVMTYAQRGHGRRANLFTDFTFAVPNQEGILVTFTKAYSGLTDVEFKEITSWIKNNTIERFGPVSSVKPELVFEIAFEGIALSKRHKSGIALRFPRIKLWRRDKKVEEIDTLQTLVDMIKIL